MVQFFKLASDATRLRILFLLLHEKELNVCTLCDRLQQSQPAVSHHLGLLRVAGLIICRRDGKHNYYRIIREKLEVLIQLLFDESDGGGHEFTLPKGVVSYHDR